MKFLKIAAALAATAALTTAAHGATVYSGSLGDVAKPTDTSQQVSFASAAAAGELTFKLDGFASLDGDNFYKDIFTLNVNGTDIFSGSFDLGGGGSTLITLDSNGATYTGGTFGSFAGGALYFTVPVALQAANTITFSYASPGAPYAGFQGLGDEGWGVGSVEVTAVPEPANAALLLAGLGAMGLVLRRRARHNA
jgi:hypothetical protein